MVSVSIEVIYLKIYKTEQFEVKTFVESKVSPLSGQGLTQDYHYEEPPSFLFLRVLRGELKQPYPLYLAVSFPGM